jgi:hypothetical protein
MIQYFKAKTRLKAMRIQSFKAKEQGHSILIETWQWNDEVKLKWVLAQPKELAFYGETHILMKVGAIWNRITEENIEKDPYTQFSYYNEDERPEPLEVLEVVLDFMETTLAAAEQEPSFKASPLAEPPPSNHAKE